MKKIPRENVIFGLFALAVVGGLTWTGIKIMQNSKVIKDTKNVLADKK